MSKIIEIIKYVLLYVWQLPQNIVGLFIRLIYTEEVKHTVAGIQFWYCKSFSGGISLGNMVMIGSKYELTVRHEYGHQIQSKILGPLYLLVIGIPSIVWAGLYGSVIKYTHNGYYKFYTESWADKLGKVKR